MKVLLFLLVFLFLFVTPVSARPNGAPDDPAIHIGPCKTQSYCDPTDKKTLIKKSGCRIAYQFEDECESSDAKCRESGNWCVCVTQRLPNSCGNQGGIQDASTNSVDKVFGRIEPPPEIGSIGTGSGAISTILQRIIQLMYTVGAMAFVIFFIWNALQLIISGGDKDKVAGARKHITWSIIGITLMALAFPIMKVIESIIGIKFFF